MKVCRRCKREAPLSAFYRRQPGKYYSECKLCTADRSKMYRANIIPLSGRHSTRIRALVVTEAGRQALREAEDAEARRKAMDFLFAPLPWESPSIETLV